MRDLQKSPWRRPIASLNYLLTSHVWRQDHNGFSHRDPGFIDLVVNKKADIIRVYLPPEDKLIEHKEYIRRYGQDMPEVREWRWQVTPAARGAALATRPVDVARALDDALGQQLSRGTGAGMRCAEPHSRQRRLNQHGQQPVEEGRMLHAEQA